MAATGFTPISLYYTTTSAAVPLAANLVAGELAINTNDGKLFYKDSSGVVQVIGTKGGVGSSTTTQVLYNSSGLVVGSANMTFNGTGLTLANDASISGLTVGKGGGAVGGNTAIGQLALSSNTTGGYNAALGYGALYLNTTASYNTAIGRQALSTNVVGQVNTAVGVLSLGVNLADANTALGGFALQANTTGANNTAVGSNALNANTTASNNTAVGYQAGYTNVTGTANTVMGYQSGRNVTGSYVTATGYQAGYATTSSNSGNDFYGYQAGFGNTTGDANAAFGVIALYANTTGSFNTAFGNKALYNNTTASNNTAVGYQAGYSTTTNGNLTAMGVSAGYNSTAVNNTFFGVGAGYGTTTGGGNTCIGAVAGYALTTGQGNTFIGGAINGVTDASGRYVTTGSKNTILGCYNGNQGGLDIRTASNYIVLSDGDGNPRAICGAGLSAGSYLAYSGAWTLGLGGTTGTYDGSLFLNGAAVSGYGPVIVGLANGVGKWIAGSNSFIKGGTTYDTYTVVAGSSGGVNLTAGATSWVSASDARLKNVTGKYDNALADIAQLEPVKFTWKSDAENKPQVGVLAQSVEKVVPEAIDTMRVDKEDETEYLGVRYTELIPLMIASIQELKAEVDSLKQQLGK